MREFVFQGINSAWERSFVFDSIRELTIGNLKDLIRSTNCDFEKSQQLLVYEGCVLQSDSFLLADLLGDDDSNPITFRVFSIQTDQRVANVSMDPLSITAAKEYFARTQHNMCYCTDNACSDKNFCSDVTAPDPSLLTWKALVDTLSVPINNETDNNPFSADGTTATAAVPETVGGVANPEVAPAPAAVAVPAPGAVAAPGPVLPVVNWLQWGVMAKLILVSLLFTYNRNLSTERLVHMAGAQFFISFVFFDIVKGFLFQTSTNLQKHFDYVKYSFNCIHYTLITHLCTVCLISLNLLYFPLCHPAIHLYYY